MFNWHIRDKATKRKIEKLEFACKEDADGYIQNMGRAFVPLYEAVPDVQDRKMRRMLTEGLVQGDLVRIILPQISIDEYVPGDPSTDNIVFAFFIKGVPEAVIPFRDFVMKTGGVIDVAYGDSDTIPNTSIVYAEMSRGKFRFEHLSNLMIQVAKLADLEVEDFSMMFPSSNQRYPFSKDTIHAYFEARTRKRNWQAQKQAIDDEKQEENEGSPEEQREAMIEHLAHL